MSTVGMAQLTHYRISLNPIPKFHLISKRTPPLRLNCTQTPNSCFSRAIVSRYFQLPKAVSATAVDAVETVESPNVTFRETFELERVDKVEGKITIRIVEGENEECLRLAVGCSLPGKWILHWGVHYTGDVGSEWDQPPLDVRPPGSIPIKDYAIETPFQRNSDLSGEESSQVTIEIDAKSSIAAIKFVLKDAESGDWYQHSGRNFEVPLIDYFQGNGAIKPEATDSKGEDIAAISMQKIPLHDFYEEHSVVKQTVIYNSLSVSIRHCQEKAKNILDIQTDLPGDVVVHWGVCRDESRNWEIPTTPYPPETLAFKNKALRTHLQPKNDGDGSLGSFELDEELFAFVFVLKLNEETWLNCKGNDFYIPLSGVIHSEVKAEDFSSLVIPTNVSETSQADIAEKDEIINEIRNLVRGISSEKSRKTKSKEAQEIILQEIEKLASEAYSIFRGSVPTPPDTDVLEEAALQAPVRIPSPIGSGFEVLCQGFNWESNKSGNWYMELYEKASTLSDLGFTVVWLPPPTDSVSPEGYLPRDLYNLNSRYGTYDELKVLIKRLHEVGIMALGDAVLNHRCAQHQNQNGVWNIFGGRLNWDDRAVVADDPHFQGRGNKSSGDNFHAAPNIDHSQEFVRKDIGEWLRWLREDVGYDGWRLDFVRGFWGGYVKEYMEVSQPCFSVGEYWDSLSYRYDEMEHNQDAHRQRIVDWISAANGTTGAFDVTTKGILHATIERCEYWRLCDSNGKPPGVMGWWPSRAVTFIENHDTGSTQGHWRFPSGREMQGYAYILTHPGTPSIFYDHIFSEYQSEIAALIALRKKNNIGCRSTVKIVKAERDVYAATIDDKLAMKIGPGHYEPSNDSQNWSFALEGNDYKVWQAS